jgi:hypothetical protein
MYQEKEKENVLGASEKLAIMEYVSTMLKSWLTWLGIANIAVLGGALVYLFFLLPPKVAKEGLAGFDQQIKIKLEENTKAYKAELEKLKNKYERDFEHIDTLYDQMLIDYGKSLAKTAQLQQKSAENEKAVVKLSKNLEDISADNLSQIASVIATLKSSGDATDILNQLVRLKSGLLDHVKQTTAKLGSIEADYLQKNELEAKLHELMPVNQVDDKITMVLGKIIIEAGIAKTAEAGEGYVEVKFSNPFKWPPHITANSVTSKLRGSGGIMLKDIDEKGFKAKLADRFSGSSASWEIHTGIPFNYIAVGIKE